MEAVYSGPTEQPDTDELVCECIACAACDGEGTANHTYTIRGRWYTDEIKCSRCKGTGKDDGDCAVHGK